MTQTHIAPLNSRSIIAVTGPETESFLQGITSQNIEGMENGEIRFSTLLTPQGKVLFDFFVIKIDDGFLLDCFAPASEALVKRLKLYKLRANVDIALRDDVSVYASWGDNCDAPSPDGTTKDPRLAALGWRSIQKPSAITATEEAYHAHRMSIGVPQFGDDFSGEEVFLLDVNYDVLNGVDYKKGCFVGQEVTSRMKRKGEIRKRTLKITTPIDDLTHGADILAGGKTLGTILAAANRNALAIIRIDRFEKTIAQGAAPSVNDQEVTITVPEFLHSA